MNTGNPHLNCRKCVAQVRNGSRVYQFGSYYRKSDRKKIRRYRCDRCGSTHSDATHRPDYREKKRHLNPRIYENLVSTMSQNRTALTLSCSRSTVVRKFVKLSTLAKVQNLDLSNMPKQNTLYFDELKSSIHTKHKPVSIPLVVHESRMILGIGVASIPANTLRSDAARKQFGNRKNERPDAIRKVLAIISPLVTRRTEFLTDDASDYPTFIRASFREQPIHLAFKGRKASTSGYGELKQGSQDPLFPINHTAAMLRAHVNRLLRRTWNTSKLQERLDLHLNLYVYAHNSVLVPLKEKKARRALCFERSYDALIRSSIERLRAS